MTLFDAIGHSFATIAIGGFSTHDTSIAFFDSAVIEMIAAVFMLVSGVNFALHFFAWDHKSLKHYFDDSEFKFYIGMLLVITLISVPFLYFSGTYGFEDAFFKGIFEVVSITTTTGFSTADFSSWPTFLPFLLFYMAIIGCCAGSTGGGMKVIRVLLIIKQGFREIEKADSSKCGNSNQVRQPACSGAGDRIRLGIFLRLRNGLHGYAAGTSCRRSRYYDSLHCRGREH